MAIVTLTANETGANSLIDINANFVDLDTTKADLASPTFTGTPTLPTGTVAVTQTAGDNSTKVATTAYADAAGDAIVVETTSGATHSLTTVASQKVVVIATGQLNTASTANETLTIKYNGVTKQTILSDIGGTWSNQIVPFCLTYTETPGAATANIVVASDAGSVSNVTIVVMKIL